MGVFRGAEKFFDAIERANMKEKKKERKKERHQQRTVAIPNSTMGVPSLFGNSLKAAYWDTAATVNLDAIPSNCRSHACDWRHPTITMEGQLQASTTS